MNKVKKQSNIYTVIKRNILNSTYQNLLDEHIIEITLWKRNLGKYIIYILLYIISFGIFFFIEKKWKRIFTLLACSETKPEQAQYAQIKDSVNKYHIVLFQKENYNDINSELKKETIDKLTKEQIEQSPYISFEINNLNENYTFSYQYNKYELKKDSNCFIGVSFDLSNMKHVEIQETFNKEGNLGIPSISLYNYMYNKFGSNKVKFNSNEFWRYFFRQLFSPIYLYNIASIICWFLNDYSIYAIITLLLLLGILNLSAYQNHSNFKKLNRVNEQNDFHVQRQFSFKENKEWNYLQDQIIPGDILTIEEGDYLPCDCLILDGYCTVDQSDLTGENNVALKTELPNNDTSFSYINSSKHFIYQGNKVTQCYSASKKKSCVTILVINTGNNTYRGNLLQNFDMYHEKNISFFYDMKYFIIFIVVVWIIVSIILLILGSNVMIINYFDSLFMIFPPTLLITLNFSMFLFDFSLRKYHLLCFTHKKLDAVGKINTILLDKTRTLTKEDIAIQGLFSTNIVNGQLLINDKVLLSPFYLNSILKKYLSEFKREDIFNYHTDLKYNLIYFIECIVSCNGLYLIRDCKEDFITFGDLIDKQIFELMKWQIRSVKDNCSFKEKSNTIYIVPPNSFYINQIIHQHSRISFQQEKNRQMYKLEYLNQFEFGSQSQLMSVIVRNTFDNTVRLYTKGSPEKIKLLCRPDTIPDNYDSFYITKAEQGYRILACATRLLSEEELTLEREELEAELTFIGLISLINPLKKNTKNTISQLMKSNCKIAIVSGDNAYTTISVARECGLINKSNAGVHLFDYNTNSKQFVINTLTNMNTETNNENENINTQIIKKKKKNKLFPKHIHYKSEKRTSKKKSVSYSGSSRLLTKDKQDSFLKINDIQHYYLDDLPKLVARMNMILNNAKSILCVNGLAWEAIQEYISQPSLSQNQESSYKFIMETIKQKGVIFSRMIPTQKAKLVKFFQQNKDSVVCMCGDGVNDSIALMTADVGISVSKSVNASTLISHFYSPNNSIQVIESLLRCGREYYERNTVIFKYLFLFGIIQITNLFIFIYLSLQYTMIQYLYIDLFFCLIPGILLAQTAPLDELNDLHTFASLINFKFLIGLVGQSILQFVFQIIFTSIFSRLSLMIERNDEIIRPDLADLFLTFSTFQYINTLFVVNIFSTHKKSFFHNYWILIYQSFLYLYNICIFTVKQFKNFFFGFCLVNINTNYDSNLEKRIQDNRILTLFFSAFQLIVSIMYEYVLEKCIQKKSQMKQLQQQLEKNNT